ncbi:MAG TPA: RNA methyltransferase [Vicinamibacterales bacterium]|nr:RNA methyltransferase [Vicinamibacterales bacterium]
MAIGYSVQDPGNVGAIIRVAEAAGGTGVVAGTMSADPLSWKAIRASMGSALRLPLGRDTGAAINAARAQGCRIVALAPRGGRSLFELDLRKPTAIVIGGEGAGIPIGLLDDADDCATIPMRSPVESLNAAVTAAIALYEAHRQRSA